MTPCIEWQGARAVAGGYGVRRIAGRTVRVHRLEWQEHHGPIADGLMVCHRCDNPPCYNIDHLFLGSPKDNTGDMVAKGRQNHLRKTHCIHGHPLAGANLKPSTRGARVCRECDNRRKREHMARRRAASRYDNGVLFTP